MSLSIRDVRFNPSRLCPRRMLVKPLLVLIMCGQLSRAWNATCIDAAKISPALPQLKARSRPWPTLSPVTSDWPLNARPLQELPPWPKGGCGHEVFRFKIHKGVVWCDRDLSSYPPLVKQRNAFLDMLLVAIWLYEGTFPDVDLFVNLGDVLTKCAAPVPFFQLASLQGVRRSNLPQDTAPHLSHLIDPKGRGQPGKDPLVGIADNDEDNFDVDPMHWVDSSTTGRGQGNESFPLAPYSRGFAIPTPDDWLRLSLPPENLRTYSDCLVDRFASTPVSSPPPRSSTGSKSRNELRLDKAADQGNTWASKHIPQVLWRGSGNGYMRGWSPAASTNPDNQRTKASRTLFNKRLYMSLMSRPYPWLNIGLKGSGKLLESKEVVEAAFRPAVDQEEWSRYMFSISIDGHGTPWRLARQMLGMAPILKVDSPLKEWFSHLLKSGVHYEPIHADLRNLPIRSLELLREAQRNSTRLERMAEATRDLVIQNVNVFAQLDYLMVCILRVKQICQWAVQPPALPGSSIGEKGWHLVRQQRHSHESATFHHMHREIITALPLNFMERHKSDS
ncbi:hypothetical protein V8C86DRAFT_2866046 [Haematococcus lacustris]